MVGIKKTLIALTSAGMLCSCARAPNVTVGYFLPKSSVSFKVIRTVACDQGNNPIIATAVTPSVKHSADTSERYTLEYTKLKGAFADSDVKFEFYEDGRLSGVNASSTGQGEAILKTAITLATAVLGFDGGAKSYPAECAEIKTYGGGKPLTLTYEGDIDPDKPSTEAQQLEADTASTFYAHRLEGIVGNVYAFVLDARKPVAPATDTPGDKDAVLHARQPGAVQIKVSVAQDEKDTGTEVWKDYVQVSQAGTDYDLPIPKPALFGKQSFAAAFTESGALKSLQYARNTGAGQVLNVGSAALTALQGDSVATQAANIKAEADLIAQQQRLVGCLANPTGCK